MGSCSVWGMYYRLTGGRCDGAGGLESHESVDGKVGNSFANYALIGDF